MPRFTPLRGLACLALASLFSPAHGATRFTDAQGRPLDVPPKVVKQGKLEYPELFASDPERAFRGSAVVQLTVGTNGEVLAPTITFVSHPAFVPPALDALFRTKFSPGEIGQVPVACPFTYTFTFDVEGAFGRKIGVDPFTLPPETPPDCPDEYRYDVPPRPQFICEPVYPRELLVNKIEGEARVLFIVDRTGRVSETKVQSATHPEFGAAMVAAVEAWRFLPPKRLDRPTMTLVSRVHKFSLKNKDLASDGETSRVLKLLRASDSRIVDASTLPQMPKLRYEPKPEYPRALTWKKLQGEAEIEFVIDRKGRVRLPRVVSATDPAFGWAAATAVQQWYYEAPQAGDRAVDVRVVLPFKFSPPAPAAR